MSTTLTFIIGHDGSDHADNALRTATTLGRAAHATLIVAVVQDRPASLAASAEATLEHDRAIGETADHLDNRLRNELADYPGAWTIERRTGRPADELIELAQRHHADAVIVGHRGHNPLVDLLLGSTTTRLLSHSPTPVIVSR